MTPAPLEDLDFPFDISDAPVPLTGQTSAAPLPAASSWSLPSLEQTAEPLPTPEGLPPTGGQGASREAVPLDPIAPMAALPGDERMRESIPVVEIGPPPQPAPQQLPVSLPRTPAAKVVVSRPPDPPAQPVPPAVSPLVPKRPPKPTPQQPEQPRKRVGPAAPPAKPPKKPAQPPTTPRNRVQAKPQPRPAPPQPPPKPQPTPNPGRGFLSHTVPLVLMGLLLFLCGALAAYFFGRNPATDSKPVQTTRSTPPATHPGPPTTRPVTPVDPGEDLVVDPNAPPNGRRFRTIADALKAAPPGAKIKIKKGTYPAIILDKKVHLVGEGSRGEVVVNGGNASALTMRCEGCAVRNLTLRGEVGSDNEKHPIVKISHGELDGCDVEWVGQPSRKNDAGACAVVAGDHVRPTLKGCRLRNGWPGLWIVEGATPVVKHCTIENSQIGVWVEKAGGNFEECVVCKNRAVNVTVIGRGTQVELKKCDVFDAEEAGVVVREGGELKLSACKIHHNTGWAFEVRGADSYLDASACQQDDVHHNGKLNDKQWVFDDEKTFLEPKNR